MTHVTADPSRTRTHHGGIGRAHQHVVAVTTGDGTSTTLTPTDPGVTDPHALGASAKWAGWDRHGPWVDVSEDAWPIIAASGGAGATVRFCAIAEIGPFLRFLGVIAIAAVTVTEWVKHHPPCPGDQKFTFYFGDTPSYCHD
ncbi:hypothetical protein FGG90_13550 [Clavibacter tessellarius]|uniref:Uncharacterized protein n=1 Tax=Clavibacter tessellarius TaxID=31965 RepID=A0A225CK25_9MICO|nr:hypothetical protein [Clavibacter michiganensis]OQJ62092.1 hypothetical protein B5P24_03165 [Clavibacter michiganensis subsp. tessellarius]UKF34911.1 hypothetical protein FGG90_13550 [Clavibacter michiganensis subsp. tessellarius]